MRRTSALLLATLLAASLLSVGAPAAAVEPVRVMAIPILPGFCTPFDSYISPGQTIEKSCFAYNDRSLVDLSVWTFVNQDTIRVFDAQDNEVSRSDPDWATFVGFFRLSVHTQRILTRGDAAEGEASGEDLAPLPRRVSPYRTVCDQRELTDLKGAETLRWLRKHACLIGRIRGSEDLYPWREYVVGLTMISSGNQTRFAGWGITWNEIQRYRSPAEQDCGVAWTCPPGALPGTYER